MSWDLKLFQRHLTTRRFGREVRYFDEVDSTNRWLTEHAHEFAASGTVVIADHQTQGRGRHHRIWFDRSGDCILFSCLLKHSIKHDVAGWLMMLPAISLAEYLNTVVSTEAEILLKWPNDVLLNGKKLAGVLGQSTVRSGQTLAVVGMGINVNSSLEDMPATIPNATSVLIETGKIFEREIVLAQVLKKLEDLFDLLLNQDVFALQERWQAFGASIGARMNRVEDAETISGSFAGIGQRGQLLLRDDSGVCHEYYSGDIIS